MLTHAVDPASLVAASALRYQLGETNLVRDVAMPANAPAAPGSFREQPEASYEHLAALRRKERFAWRATGGSLLAALGTLFGASVAAVFGADLTVTVSMSLASPVVFGGSAVFWDRRVARYYEERMQLTAPAQPRAVEVPANVRDAWNRIRSVAKSYGGDPDAPAMLAQLEAGAWVCVLEIAAHVDAGTLGRPECVAAADALFRAAAQADTYDVLRRLDSHVDATSEGAQVLDSVDLTDHLNLLAPTPAPAGELTHGAVTHRALLTSSDPA